MKFRVVIPARFGSERLPGKPMADVSGRALILRTADRALESGASEVIIATDHPRIAKLCESDGLTVVMTRADHQSGTDRIAEVAAKMAWADDEVVVNVQGDEPCLPAANIDQVAALLQDRQVGIATLATAIVQQEEFRNPNVVKVVCDRNGLALYFSRAAIPCWRDSGPDVTGPDTPGLRHIGLYAYRVDTLRRFSRTPVCNLEQTEKLEQLRALWHGWPIRVAVACVLPAPGVDTPADLEAARHYFNKPDHG